LLLAPVHHPTSTLEDMNMMATINHPTIAIADEDEANGVEIIPTTGTGTATDESPNILVDAPAPAPPQAMPWRKVVIGIGALCATGGVSYFLAGSGSIASSNMKMMNLQTDAIKMGGHKFTLFGDDTSACADDQGNLYSWIRYEASSAEECGESCSNCPGNGQKKDLVLRGFEYVRQYGTCYCLVDSDISFPLTFCSNEGALQALSGVIGGQSGSGEIMNTASLNGSDQCWKVSSKGSKATKSSKQPIRRKLGQKNSHKSE